MDWIKVTPDTMPPDKEPVLATIERNGKRRVYPEVRFDTQNNVWEWCLEAYMDYWDIVDGVVTHFAHYPAPAED